MAENISIKELQDTLLDRVEIKIQPMENHPSIIARVILDFGVFKIKGFTVRQKELKMWVQPPCVRSGNKYPPIFFTEDKDYWRKLETKILQHYDNESIKEAITF